jgi:protein phosphatase
MRTAADRLRGRGPMPAPRRRRRGIKIAAAVIGAVVILGGAFLLARSVYFLGTNDQGNVALYRGLPYELPLGINLYSEQYSVPVQEGTLSEDRQKAVTEHELRGKGDASSLINDIKTRPTAGLPPPPPPPTPPKKKAAASKKSKQAQQSP